MSKLRTLQPQDVDVLLHGGLLYADNAAILSQLIRV
jgi:hypothetical protein